MNLSTPAMIGAALLGACGHPSGTAERRPPEPPRTLFCDPAAPAPVRFERSPGGVPEVGATWVAANHCHVRVVDVRETPELAVARVPVAEHVPLARVAEEATAWDVDAPVVLLCRSGRRSARAARQLEDMGFSRVASMTGGVLAWEQLGLPVERGVTEAYPRVPDAGPPHLGPLSRDAIEAHLGEPTGVRWVKAAALLMQGTQSCVDGRDHTPVIGTPGGDAGELVLALAALEATRGAPLDDAEVHRLLDAHLEAFGRFYIHTDAHALAGLADDPRFAAAVREHGVEALVRHPPRRLEAPLLSALTSPAHVGCGHLRLVLSNPEEYGVRAGLAATLLRAVFERLWQGEAIDLVVLEGPHHEGAVVNVRLGRPVHSFTRIPTLAPRVGQRELFVNHPEVSEWLREENAAFLFEVDPWLRAHPDRREAFLQTLEALGRRQLGATLAHLARSLPVYEARIGPDSIEVEGPLR